MLPEGWTRRPLGEIAHITSGGTPDRAEPSYWGGDIPWVTTGEIRFNTITDTTERITAAGLKNSSAKVFPPGTLLMAMYGQGKTRGQVAKLGIEAATNQACAAITLNPGHHPDYFFQVLASKYDDIRELGNAGTQKNLNGGIIKEIEVPVPEITEQLRIGQLLACWDETMAATAKLLVNSRRQKQALIESLISGKCRLKGETTSWPLVALKEVASILVSSVDKKHENGERPVSLCNYTDVYYNDHITSDIPFMAATATEGEIAKFSLRRGDVLITKDSETPDDIAISAHVADEIPGLICGYHLAIVRPDLARVDSEFLHGFFGLRRTRAYFTSHANGATRFGLPIHAIEDARLQLPGIAEQRRIAQVVSASTQRIHCLARDLIALKTEKSALMQQLLTGKRRLSFPESAP